MQSGGNGGQCRACTVAGRLLLPGELTDFESHIRDEFSTFAWILEGLLDQAGFELISSDFPRTTHGELLCRRR